VDFRISIAQKTEGRIHQGLELDVEGLRKRLGDLLSKVGQSMEDWIKDGVKAEKYQSRQRNNALANLRRMRMEIWRLLASRSKEYYALHKFSLGSYLALFL